MPFPPWTKARRGSKPPAFSRFSEAPESRSTQPSRGRVGVLAYRVHGKPSWVSHSGKGVFEGLPDRFQVGRSHSLFAARDTFPACLKVTAESDDGVIMGVRHKELPVEAVQFHPESILTAEENCGMRLMENVARQFRRWHSYAAK